MPKANILIVEDEAVVAADLAGKLERAGYRSIGIACDGEDAVETAKALVPDLVLMDIRLAGPIDGIKTAERIQAFRNIPIVYLTAHSDMATLRRAAATEPFGYILKPFEERDVTTQIEIALFKHQAERRLRESEERYRKLVETAMDSIITFDHAGLILSCNAATEHMFGYRSEEMVGRNISMLLPAWFAEGGDESPADAASRIMRLIGLWREVNGRRRQGDDFPVEIAVSESFSNGEIRYTGILRDISERKRTEAELRWRAGLLAQTHDAVVVWRMGGGVIYWNHGAEELYGWNVAEAAGRPIHRLLSSALPLSEEEFHRQLVENGRWQGEIRQATKGGQAVIVESRMVTMTEEFGGILVLETNRDVTERRAIHEKVCRLAEELEDRVKDRTKELLQSQTLLRQLASELTIAEQRERRRIATDLHDYLAQLLVCARLKVSQSRGRHGRLGSRNLAWRIRRHPATGADLYPIAGRPADPDGPARIRPGGGAQVAGRSDAPAIPAVRAGRRAAGHVRHVARRSVGPDLPIHQRAPHQCGEACPRRSGGGSDGAARWTAGDRCHRRRPRIRYDHFAAPEPVFEIWIVQHRRAHACAGRNLRVPVHTRQGHDSHAHAAPSGGWR